LTDRRTTDLRIELASPANLFAAACEDPFDSRYDPVPGIQKIIGAVSSLPLIKRADCRLTLVLADGAEDADCEGRVREALQRYCQGQVTAQRYRHDILRHVGWRQLWMGLGLLALCLILSTAISGANLPDFVAKLFGEGLVIAGWVVLWRPVETLVFDIGRLDREIDLLETIAKMPVDTRVSGKTRG